MPATALALKQYRLLSLELAPLCQQQHWLWNSTDYFPYSWHHCASNNTSSDAVLDTSLTVGTNVPTIALALMQYRLFPLQLTPLCKQEHQLWCSIGYIPYSWYHCTNNSTSSDAVLDTCLTVGTIEPTTALTLMQYCIFALLLAPLCQQQHYLWCSTGYFPYCWHHCASNRTTRSSGTVLVTTLTVGITIPTTALSLMQYRLLALLLTPLCQQQHQLWCSSPR